MNLSTVDYIHFKGSRKKNLHTLNGIMNGISIILIIEFTILVYKLSMLTVEKIADYSENIWDLSERGFSKLTLIITSFWSKVFGLYPRILINLIITSTIRPKTKEVFLLESEDYFVSLSSLFSSGEEL